MTLAPLTPAILSNPGGRPKSRPNVSKRIMNKLFRYCSTLLLSAFGKRCVCPPPPDEILVQAAKLVRAYRIGCMTLGHYQSNSKEPPDHITTQHLRSRSQLKGNVEQLSWTVAPASPEQIAACPLDERFSESGHLVALSDVAGNIALFAFLTEEEAKHAMDTVGRAGCPGLTDHELNPLSPDSGEFVTNYPLTREELRLLTLHWVEEYLDSTASVHNGTGGTTESLVSDYATSRLVFAEAVFGSAGYKAIEQEAQLRILEEFAQESRDSLDDWSDWDSSED